jgi:hypothetical protein
MGYSTTTDKHLKVYSPELGYTTRSSKVTVDESVQGGAIDLRIRNCEAGSQGTYNVQPDRKPRGRPSNQLTEKSSPAVKPAIKESAVPKTVPKVVIPHFIPPPNVPVFDKLDDDVVVPIQEETTDTTSRHHTPTVEDAIDEPESAVSPADNIPPRERQELLKYFTRAEKRKRTDSSAAETEQYSKVVKAMLAQMELSTEDLEILERAFPATEINGVKIPQTYQQAINDPTYSKQWKLAITEEIISLIENGTWKQVVPPASANLVSTKWVFTIKTKADGTIERFKARLVARGFSQVHGQDYSETFAPTVRMDTLRLFLAIVALENLECSQFDIKNAFTESRLKEKIYMSPPQGVEVKKGFALQVLRSLYGLKQAARDWNLLIKRELLQWGFVQSLADPCMFIHPQRGIRLLVYVDDVVAAAKEQGEIDWFFEKLSGRFNAKNLGEIHKILGVRVSRDRQSRSLYLDQEQYLRTVLEKFGLREKANKDKKIPMADYKQLRPATDDDTRIDATQYQEGIGSLMHAMVLTRPDIAFVLGRLSQYMSDPAEHHGHALKNLMRYLRTTVTQKLRYGKGGVHEHFVVYSDADWASDKADRKSVSGSVTMFYSGPICWSSKKQRSVATSSCESEYMAMAMCAKLGQWLAQIFRDLQVARYIGKNANLVEMRGDNQGALALVKNPHLHERSKHIDICYHFIRDLAEKGKLNVEFIPTTEMVADGMTKPLQRVAFERFKAQLGVVN